MTPKDTLLGTLSAPPAKLDSNVVKPQNLTKLTEDSQQPPSHSSPTDISKSFLAQVHSRKHKPDLQTRKRRRHKYRLCCNCRQTTHLKAHCPQTLHNTHQSKSTVNNNSSEPQKETR